MRGEVVIVGAGPGDPELITIRGLRELQRAGVILYDRLVSPELLKEARSDALLIPVGKMPGKHSVPQNHINEILVDYAVRGYRVVRLKGGDPYTFGRGEEECIYVQRRGVPCTVVPGIPSFTAAAVLAGIPLTSRGVASSFAVATGKEDPSKGRRWVNLTRIAGAVDTLVVLMGVGEAPRVFQEVATARGWEEPAAIIRDASLPSQAVYTGSLRELSQRMGEEWFRPPAVMVFGRVVELREKLCDQKRVSYC